MQCHGSVGQIAEHDPIAGEETQSALVQLIERAGISIADVVQSYSEANSDFWSREASRPVECIRPAWSAPAHVLRADFTARGLVVGRMQRWKGPQTVCEALRRMGADAPDMDWIGRDTAWGARGTSTLAQMARTFPGIWGKLVTNFGPVSPEEVANRQAAALFNLVPSTWDVFNFTTVEAMGSGRPTVVSTGAGASELIEDGVNGFLFRSGDPQSLAETLDRLLRHPPGRLLEIGRNGRETVRRTLDPDTIAAVRMDAYRNAAARFARKARAPISPWVSKMLTPHDDRAGGEMSFLDHHPLRTILGYALSRYGRKLSEFLAETIART